MTKKGLAVTTALIALVSTGCADVYAQGVARKVANDLDKIDSYTGTVVERGAIEGVEPLVSKVVYEKPFRARVEVVSPAKHAGEMFMYDGKRMIMWSPTALVGIEVTGFESPNKREVYEHIRRLTSEAMSAYAFSLRSEYRKVAGQRATEWRINPTRRHPFRVRHSVWNHSRYSMPLKLEIKDAGGKEWYAMEFETIEFNKPIAATSFDFEFPENAVVFRWDLSAPGITVEQAKRQMNFDLRLPKKLPKGHAVGKIIKSPHCLPAIVVTMNNGASWLSLTESRHIEGIYKPRGKQVNVGERIGTLSFLGTFASVTWVVGNTQLTLTGNLSFPALLDIAASVE